MKIGYKGNYIAISIPANEEQPLLIQLKDGYSYEEIFIISATNISFHDSIRIDKGDHLKFPPINSKSPCSLKPTITDTTKAATLKFLITKFGQIPDLHYFDAAFEPILVKGDDGKDYKVIPSDQFK